MSRLALQAAFDGEKLLSKLLNSQTPRLLPPNKKTATELRLRVRWLFLHLEWRLMWLNLEVEAGALDGVGAHFAVGYCQVVGVLGVAFEGFGGFEGAVEHHVGV